MKAELNYEDDMRIDPNALDVEWLEQPNLYIRYAEAAAQARDYLDRLKEKLDVMRAELDNKVRLNPETYLGEGTKVTNPAVDAVVLMNPDYKAAQDEFFTQKLNVDLLSSALRALDHRKAALENLVRLHAASYFAGPQEPRDLGKEYKEHGQREIDVARKREREALNQKKTRRRS